MKINDVVATRRKMLALWIDSKYQEPHKQSQFLRDLETRNPGVSFNQGEMASLLKNKSFGEKKARSLEIHAGMPIGYLDNNISPDLNDDEIIINEYLEVKGAMGSGVILRDQPGQITAFKVNAEWMNKNIPSNTGKGNLAVVTGFGDSMNNMFKSGDPLIVDTGVKTLEFDGVYFFRVGDEGFIKTLQRIPGVGIRVISGNSKYESWTITEDMDFEIFGSVVKAWKTVDF